MWYLCSMLIMIKKVDVGGRKIWSMEFKFRDLKNEWWGIRIERRIKKGRRKLGEWFVDWFEVVVF